MFRKEWSREGAESGSHTHSPGHKGAAVSSSGFVLLDPWRFAGINGPASWPVSRMTGAVLIRTTGLAIPVFGGTGSLYAPFQDLWGHQHACTGKRPVSWREALSAFNSGGDEAPLSSGVPHHALSDLDGVMMIIRGRQPTRHIYTVYIYIYIYIHTGASQ